MQRLLIKNIHQLIQVRDEAIEKIAGAEMDKLPLIENAWLAIEDGVILDYGTMADFPGITDWQNLKVIDAEGKLVLPCWVDAHTHIVYAQNRAQEFVDRIKGLSYEEIASRGGGILNSVAKLRLMREDDLFHSAAQRLNEMIAQGTGAVEIKSGYGLDLENELKMLRVIRRLKENSEIEIKATFLGAHAVPVEFKGRKSDYVNHIVNEMIPAVAAERLADFADIFCERNYFDTADVFQIMNAAAKHGITPKVHAEQLSNSGGVIAGVTCGAISVDHLEFVGEREIEALKGSKTMPVILPGAAWFLNLPHPPARKMIDSGLPLAISSDYNPGSSPSGNMKLMQSIACVQYNLTPAEVINASTINSAYAMALARKTGAITRGLPANLILTKPIEHYNIMPYSFGSDLIDAVFIKGVRQ